LVTVPCRMTVTTFRMAPEMPWQSDETWRKLASAVAATSANLPALAPSWAVAEADESMM